MLSSFFLFFSRRAELRARGQDDKGCKAALLARLRSAVHAGIPRIAGEGGEERGAAERGGEERRAGKGWNDEADLDEQPAPSHQEGGGGHGAETVSLPRAGGGHADAVDLDAVDAGVPDGGGQVVGDGGGGGGGGGGSDDGGHAGEGGHGGDGGDGGGGVPSHSLAPVVEEAGRASAPGGGRGGGAGKGGRIADLLAPIYVPSSPPPPETYRSANSASAAGQVGLGVWWATESGEHVHQSASPLAPASALHGVQGVGASGVGRRESGDAGGEEKAGGEKGEGGGTVAGGKGEGGKGEGGLAGWQSLAEIEEEQRLSQPRARAGAVGDGGQREPLGAWRGGRAGGGMGQPTCFRCGQVCETGGGGGGGGRGGGRGGAGGGGGGVGGL